MKITGLNSKIYIFFGAVLTIITPSSGSLQAQNPVIVKKTKSYIQQTNQDSLHKTVEIKDHVPFVVYDLRYATAGNFTKQQLYANNRHTYLRLPAVNALVNVQRELKEKGMGIKVFDAYRPYSVTKKMWELIKDERYLANPAKGSGHNRGLAIDLTLIHLQSGEELNMGTGFDHFSDTAHHSFKALSNEILENRKLLREVMIRNGFQPLETEWWHYSWPNDRNYPVLDLSFKELAKLAY
jgi:D-alanyl-D-alanine dipeptidase